MTTRYIAIACGKWNTERNLYETTNNPQDALIGCELDENYKTPEYFDLVKKPTSQYEHMKETTLKENKRGHRISYMTLDHHHAYSAYAKNNYTDEEIRKMRIKKGAFLAFITINTTENKKARGNLVDIQQWFPNKNKQQIATMVNEKLPEYPTEFFSLEQIKPILKKECEIYRKAIKERIKKPLKEAWNYISPCLISPSKTSQELFKHEMKKQTYTKKYTDYKTGQQKTFKTTYRGWLYKKEWNKEKNRWMNEKLPRTKHPEILKSACRGARIELFNTSKEIINNVYKVDQKSSYPAGMINNEWADLTTETHTKYPETEILNEIGVTEAEIEITKDTHIGYLPFRMPGKEAGKPITIYPRKKGTIIRDVWVNQEITEAIKTGNYKINTLYQSVTYKKLPFNPFTNFFQKLYDIKEGQNTGLKHIAKLMMNSFTGRFAYTKSEKDIKKIKIGEAKKYAIQGYEYITEIGNGEILIEKNIGEPQYDKNSHPLYYALCTYYVRHAMYEQMKKIPEEDLIYLTTDCICFKEKQNLQKFKIGKTIGDWAIEKENATGQFWSEQAYEIDGETRISGFTDITNEQANTGKTITQEQTIGINRAIKQGTPELAGTTETIKKHFDGQQKTPKRLRTHPLIMTAELPWLMVDQKKDFEQFMGIKLT